MYIPDPIERLENSMENIADKYVDEHTCMQCGEKVDGLICPHPMGYGPLVCYECAGYTPTPREG